MFSRFQRIQLTVNVFGLFSLGVSLYIIMAFKSGSLPSTCGQRECGHKKVSYQGNINCSQIQYTQTLNGHKDKCLLICQFIFSVT